MPKSREKSVRETHNMIKIKNAVLCEWQRKQMASVRTWYTLVKTTYYQIIDL